MTHAICICVVVGLLLPLAACSNDRTQEPIIGLYYPPTPDLGPDLSAPDAGVDLGARDPQCDGAPQGAFCSLPQATGSCVGGRCALVACLFGWRDCDGAGETGCEADVTTAARCGACNVSCDEAQACQSGPRGWACSAGVLCEAGRFDLDGAQANGCEWSTDDEVNTRAITSPVMEVQAARRLTSLGAFWMAGSGDAGRYLTRDILDTTARPLTPLTFGDTPLAPSQAVGISGSDAQLGELFVAWRDGLSAHTVGGDEGATLTDLYSAPCQAPDKTPAPIIDLAPGRVTGGGVWAATASSVLSLRARGGCAGARCLTDEGAFGPVDYLRAFYPYADHGALDAAAPVADARFAFTAAELSACAPCALDTATGAALEDLRCQSAAQCRPAGFEADAATCPACAAAPATSCPSLDLVALLPSPTRRALYLITRRGVVLLTHDEAGRWQPAARLEAAFEPNTTTTSGFLQAAVAADGADADRLYLLHSSGYLRPLQITFPTTTAPDLTLPTIALAGPDLGVELTDTERAALADRPRQLLASDPETVLLLTAERARVLRPLAATYRSHTFERGALEGELRYVNASVRADGGFDLLRSRFGRLATQAVRPALNGD